MRELIEEYSGMVIEAIIYLTIIAKCVGILINTIMR